ncbi:type II toxin-antitoxin system MqsR family toxin [Desulfofustis limnaeus]|jgi:hypothetical protein|uniref:Type II toxin-antitoxin system MqsR family toxin n=1 Tax=Desulfofustis limnaeus TaxID=2740163 RepID=A0ABM7WAP8_9BACT|nr:hypothetical protein DPPLL_23490 [Desulfofustis limnaeus]
MPRNQPYYSIKTVRKCIDNGNFFVEPKARETAKNHFGWLQDQILAAMKELRPKHFHKSDKKFDDPYVYVDYYKARGLRGEDVYVHFRIEDGYLIICSFKRI